MIVNIVNAFSQFDNFSAVWISSNRHVTGCIEIYTDPVDFIENGEMNFNHLSVWKSDCDTLQSNPFNSLFGQILLYLLNITLGIGNISFGQ